MPIRANGKTDGLNQMNALVHGQRVARAMNMTAQIVGVPAIHGNGASGWRTTTVSIAIHAQARGRCDQMIATVTTAGIRMNKRAPRGAPRTVNGTNRARAWGG